MMPEIRIIRMLARLVILILTSVPFSSTAQLKAGVAKMDITETKVPLVNDSLYAKALVLQDGDTKMVIVTVDAVSLGEIGYIKNDYLEKVRSRIQKELNISPSNIFINTSHCHGVVCADVDERTIAAIRQAARNMVPVNVGVGTGYEERIMENRRVKLKNGKDADMRRGYSFPPDDQVAETGPVDPQIGILRLDKKKGGTLAVVYNFAMHPIESVPNGGNTADVIGFASKVIEDNLSDGTMAFFVQGCAGDINPAVYKDVLAPRDAEPLGNLLGLSTLKGVRKIQTRSSTKMKILNEKMELPRANFQPKIDSLEAAQQKLLESLQGTNVNLKTYIPLVVRYSLYPDYPSYYSHRYIHDNSLGRRDLEVLDSVNRADMDNYRKNIYIMEEMSRNQINLKLMKMHQRLAAGRKTIEVELGGIRIGDFVLTTFPGELTVRIGLNIKKSSPFPFTFVAGYTNGYIYYAPTTAQLMNMGGAQEDSDTNLAPGWQELYEQKVHEMLGKL
jgi:hypothetical protein